MHFRQRRRNPVEEIVLSKEKMAKWRKSASNTLPLIVTYYPSPLGL
jgi:hypothetical protein